MVRLGALVVEKEANRKLRRELSRILDLLDFCSGEFDCHCVRHRFNMFDSIHSDDWEYVCRL